MTTTRLALVSYKHVALIALFNQLGHALLTKHLCVLKKTSWCVWVPSITVHWAKHWQLFCIVYAFQWRWGVVSTGSSTRWEQICFVTHNQEKDRRACFFVSETVNAFEAYADVTWPWADCEDTLPVLATMWCFYHTFNRMIESTRPLYPLALFCHVPFLRCGWPCTSLQDLGVWRSVAEDAGRERMPDSHIEGTKAGAWMELGRAELRGGLK